MDLPPPIPSPSRELTIPGFRIGHGSDTASKTGVTVILCPEGGAVSAAEVRGSATGTRQLDSLVLPHHIAQRAHAVVLAGGSGYGLDAASPVVSYLEEQGHGFDTGYRRVPLVPTAILFDLAFGEAKASPGPELVERALICAAAGPVAVGSVGAGTGATVGKALSASQATKGGFGFISLTVPGGVTVAAAVAVNAFGDVRDPSTGKLIAGCRVGSGEGGAISEADGLGELLGTDRLLAGLPPDFSTAWESNTTLAVLMTDAALDKVSLLKVCQMAFGAFYRTFVPALSLYDGDLIIALSSAERPAHLHQVAVLAERALTEAILRAVREADGFGLLPTARDLESP